MSRDRAEDRRRALRFERMKPARRGRPMDEVGLRGWETTIKRAAFLLRARKRPGRRCTCSMLDSHDKVRIGEGPQLVAMFEGDASRDMNCRLLLIDNVLNRHSSNRDESLDVADVQSCCPDIRLPRDPGVPGWVIVCRDFRASRTPDSGDTARTHVKVKAEQSRTEFDMRCDQVHGCNSLLACLRQGNTQKKEDDGSLRQWIVTFTCITPASRLPASALDAAGVRSFIRPPT